MRHAGARKLGCTERRLEMASARFVDRVGFVRTACAAIGMMAAAACPVTAQPAIESGAGPGIASTASSLDTVVARARRSVVQVVATAYGTTPGDGLGHVQRLVGAGVVVEGGYVVTSGLVVADALQVQVVAHAGGTPDRVLEAEVVGVAPDLDVALLRIADAAMPPLPLATGPVQQGDLAVTVAHEPDGDETVAMGVVVASGEPVREGSPMPYLITDATASTAGAPLVNVRGEIVGLAAAFVSAPEGTPMTAAVPAALLRAAVEQLREGQAFRRGVVGLAARSVVRQWSAGGALSSRAQLVVSAVADGLPAERAGIRPGDVIVAVNGAAVDGMELATLYLALYTLREGQPLVLDIERNGERLEITPTAVSARPVMASR